jgi:amino acid adenylation domain-containing protein
MLDIIKQNIERFYSKDAFVIDEVSYSYKQFAQRISNIRALLENLKLNENEVVGVITYNDIETYSSIYALWFCGYCFLPINPLLPDTRNQEIIKQCSVRHILTSKNTPDALSSGNNVQFQATNILKDVVLNLSLPKLSDNDLMYILFTSGSTGVPKGVPINRKNLTAFVEAFFANDYEMDENDRFLQMFDFTFDVSVQCYVLPLYIGASIYTVAPDEIKFFTIYKLLEKHKITIACMVPSVIAFLRPYFSKINLPHLRHSLFMGEALYNDILNEWSACVPNARIENYYGPTEATILCIYHFWNRNTQIKKSYKGIVAIGKPFGDTNAIILSKNNQIITTEEKGELCVSGSQITLGYINLPEKNKAAFIRIKADGVEQIFYRTGDLVYRDDDGDILYCGRIDHQVQVQGYRVELGELEIHAKEIAGNIQALAIAKEKTPGNMQLFLFLEKCTVDTKVVVDYLRTVLPFYMQPTKVFNMESFPLTSSGKINRKLLAENISND